MLRKLQRAKKSVVMPFTTAVLYFQNFDGLVWGNLSVADVAR